jgi:hypothetical protein
LDALLTSTFQPILQILGILSSRNMAENPAVFHLPSYAQRVILVVVHSTPEWKRPQRKTHR